MPCTESVPQSPIDVSFFVGSWYMLGCSDSEAHVTSLRSVQCYKFIVGTLPFLVLKGEWQGIQEAVIGDYPGDIYIYVFMYVFYI